MEMIKTKTRCKIDSTSIEIVEPDPVYDEYDKY